MARRAALSIAESCNVVELQDILATVALDATDDTHIRSRAAHAVGSIGDSAAKRRLRPLVCGQCEQDSQDELKGYAMQALWPDDLTPEELFGNLSAPRQFGGTYWDFIAYYLTRQGRGPVRGLRPLRSRWSLPRRPRTSRNQRGPGLPEPGKRAVRSRKDT